MAERCPAESGNHWHQWQNLTKRQHGFDAFACRHDILGHTEPDGVFEQVSHRLALRLDRRLVRAVARQPCDARR